MKCPLLKKYKVTDEDTCSDNPDGDWAKDICLLYCPPEIKDCVEGRGNVLSIEKILLETVNVPKKVNGRLVCRKCGGFLGIDRQDETKFECINCGGIWNRPQ